MQQRGENTLEGTGRQKNWHVVVGRVIHAKEQEESGNGKREKKAKKKDRQTNFETPTPLSFL